MSARESRQTRVWTATERRRATSGISCKGLKEPLRSDRPLKKMRWIRRNQRGWFLREGQEPARCPLPEEHGKGRLAEKARTKGPTLRHPTDAVWTRMQ